MLTGIHFRGSRFEFGRGESIIEGISSSAPDIIADIQPESYEHINDDGRTHSEERDINEIFADGGVSDPDFFANIGAYTENLPFNKMPESVHETNL